MRYEMTITQADLENHFRGERDLVSYSPYQVGDKVVRCGSCHAVVKTNFITNNCCPLCGARFVPAPVRSAREQPVEAGSLKTFFWLLIGSAGFAMFPLLFPTAFFFLQEAAFGVSASYLFAFFCASSLIAAFLLYADQDNQRIWRNGGGGLLILIPAAAPYLILTAVLCVLLIFAVAAALIGCILLIGILASFSE